MLRTTVQIRIGGRAAKAGAASGAPTNENNGLWVRGWRVLVACSAVVRCRQGRRRYQNLRCESADDGCLWLASRS